MAYRGNTETEALSNLTDNVRKLLKEKGLQSVFFEAVGKDVVRLETGEVQSTAMILNVQGPLEDRLKAWPLINEEVSKYHKERAIR